MQSRKNCCQPITLSGRNYSLLIRVHLSGCDIAFHISLDYSLDYYEDSTEQKRGGAEDHEDGGVLVFCNAAKVGCDGTGLAGEAEGGHPPGRQENRDRGLEEIGRYRYGEAGGGLSLNPEKDQGQTGTTHFASVFTFPTSRMPSLE